MNRFMNIFIAYIIVIVVNTSACADNAMDSNLYESVLDSQACEDQIRYIVSNDTALRARFIDASVRIPRGILLANFRDMGNYYQCLDIRQQALDTEVAGKYCVIQVPLKQGAVIPNIEPEYLWDNASPKSTDLTSRTLDQDKYDVLQQCEQGRRSVNNILGYRETDLRKNEENPLTDVQLELALCIPRVCSSHQALDILMEPVSTNVDITEVFCRLPNDKPWAAVDYIAISIFTIIGLLTLLSTAYDVRHSFILKRDPQEAKRLYTCFSAYSNTKKLFTIKKNPSNLTCLDGIRSLTMLWIIIGHTFTVQLTFGPANPLAVYDYIKSFRSFWITSGTIAVDTFFMLSGLLLVYSTITKMSGIKLLKNLHMFYLNRLLRLYPILATAVLLQASLLNHFTDGPNWRIVAKSVDDCRLNWWSTLLYVHNLISFGFLCVGHSWYMAIDMQLYIISPIVLFWVLGGSKRSAWTALVGSCLAIITASTIYNFVMEFQAAAISFSRPEQSDYYTQYYYINTLARAAPFFVGMMFGYVLHLCRGKRVQLSKLSVALFWLIALVTAVTIIVAHHFIVQPTWDNQIIDSTLNSFMRPAWAASVAWLVFACVHGYAGPVNWFLSLNVFKVLAKLSYAMYLFHLPIMYLMKSTALAPVYFTEEFTIYTFMEVLNFTLIASVLVVVLIDSPFGSLIDIFIGGSKNDKGINKDELQVSNSNGTVAPSREVTKSA